MQERTLHPHCATQREGTEGVGAHLVDTVRLRHPFTAQVRGTPTNKAVTAAQATAALQLHHTQ